MTAPEIGNYGIAGGRRANRAAPQVAGFVVREESPIASNWRADSTLRDYLVENNIVAISDIDTRALTRVLRSAGVMRGIIATGDIDPRELVEQARGAAADGRIRPRPRRHVRAPVRLDARWPSRRVRAGSRAPRATAAAHRRLRLRDEVEHPAALHRLRLRRPRVSRHRAGRPSCWRQIPTACSSATAPAIRRCSTTRSRTRSELVDADVPVFGICLGHQVLSLALGGETYKLKFGHRGGNHPVKDLETGKVEITSQNHGFAVDPESLPSDVKVTHVNLYDGTVEGLRHETKPVFCVQYHPEAAPGPHDADYLFQQFVEEMEERAWKRSAFSDSERVPSKCPNALTSSESSSSAPARSSSARRASSTTPARRRARR